jgi:hypothetical protein
VFPRVCFGKAGANLCFFRFFTAALPRKDVASDGCFGFGGVPPIVVLWLAVSPPIVVLGLAVLPATVVLDWPRCLFDNGTSPPAPMCKR